MPKATPPPPFSFSSAVAPPFDDFDQSLKHRPLRRRHRQTLAQGWTRNTLLISTARKVESPEKGHIDGETERKVERARGREGERERVAVGRHQARTTGQRQHHMARRLGRAVRWAIGTGRKSAAVSPLSSLSRRHGVAAA
ncbi:hypothetical protein XA68_12615 [Ophiocordyceps unilateralis]|uniref:Uncharacterized protein n=1 Tax=Ophiocordyceps unilateralis TaxID=268505 RepID=A0A2A9PDE9_OPHUN|nr:hypothetical protein XA68_12615 [Ophiocordyceps unilateralis]